MDHLSVTTNSQGTTDAGADIAYLKSFLPTILFWTGFTEKVEERAADQSKQVELLRERLPAEYVPSKHNIELVNAIQVLVAAMLALTDGKLVVPNAQQHADRPAGEPEAIPEPLSRAPSVTGTAVSQGVSFSGCEQEPSLCSTDVDMDRKLSNEGDQALGADLAESISEAIATAVAEIPEKSTLAPDLQLAWQKVEVLQEEIAAVMSETIDPVCLSRQPTLEAASHKYAEPEDFSGAKQGAAPSPRDGPPRGKSPSPAKEAPSHTQEHNQIKPVAHRIASHDRIASHRTVASEAAPTPVPGPADEHRPNLGE
jgi:hypothetical protein